MKTAWHSLLALWVIMVTMLVVPLAAERVGWDSPLTMGFFVIGLLIGGWTMYAGIRVMVPKTEVETPEPHEGKEGESQS